MQIQLDATLRAPGVARHRLLEWLSEAGCDEGSAADASLIVSELVTNAVVHAHSAPTVVVERSSGRLRLEVSDGDASPPAIRSDAVVGGQGLRLVEQLSTRWGWTPIQGGKVVWAERPC